MVLVYQNIFSVYFTVLASWIQIFAWDMHMQRNIYKGTWELSNILESYINKSGPSVEMCNTKPFKKRIYVNQPKHTTPHEHHNVKLHNIATPFPIVATSHHHNSFPQPTFQVYPQPS